MFDATPSPYLMVSPDLIIVAVNDAYLKATMTRREEIVGRHIFEVMPDNPDDPTANGVGNLGASLRRVLETRRPDVMAVQRYDIRRPQSLGGGFEERYWSSRNTPVLDGKGDVAWIIHHVEDVTERTLAEQAHQEAERRWAAVAAGREAILESIGEGFCIMDRDFRLVEVNGEALRIDGRTAEELLGRTHWDVWPGSIGTQVETNYRRVMRERVPIAFEHNYVSDRHNLWLEMKAYPTEEGLAILFRDITDHKRAEQALIESEEQRRLDRELLGAVIRQAPVGISIVEAPSGRALALNDKAIELLGHGRTNTGPDRYQEYGALHTDGRPFAPEDYPTMRAIRHGEVVDQEEMIYRQSQEQEGQEQEGEGHQNQERVARFAVSSAPVRNQAGKIVAAATVFYDISERLRMEEALRRAKEEAERANIAKSKFLAAASHDLRQPMQSLLLFLDILKPHVAAKGQEALKHLGRGLDALRDLLDSLLDISQLDAGVVQPTIESFSIQDLVEQIGTAYKPIAVADGLAFEITACPSVVRSDRMLLGRMVRNLVENALRYTEHGRIGIECHEAEGRLQLRIRDTGIGIPPEHLERIWQEFHQVGNPERDRNRGLGLGLAIVQRLSHLLDHPVHVRSSPGEGSVFTVELPLGEAVPAHAPASAKEMVGNGRFAVVVDDDAIVLLGLKAIFEAWGYEVLAAGSAPQALAELDELGRRPDIVISDYRLRERQSGTDAILRIRQACGRDVPGIILTGETGAEIQQEAASHGLHIIHKPVTPRQLGDALESLLSDGR
ncbi:PAS domain-containing protein [Azospirillum sp. SYSU D00513]|uniref:PAS domain-containing protein n=1 Tax=Azospirillum sp. SYSU D00513 TaxID=2812561 RepID=UPI001A9640B1